MARCSDGSLYTGITTDLERRIAEHNSRSSRVSRYTRSRQPVQLVYQEAVENRSEASRREYQIKQLGKPDKEKLIKRFHKGSF